MNYKTKILGNLHTHIYTFKFTYKEMAMNTGKDMAKKETKLQTNETFWMRKIKV